LLGWAAAGILQGLLEWLPVSSSGQLTLYYSAVLGFGASEAYKAGLALHASTAAAAAIYYRRRLAEAVWNPGGWVARMLVLSTAAALPVGYTLRALALELLEGPLDVANAVIGALLILTAVILATAGGRGGGTSPENVHAGLWLAVGAVEGVAVLPGLSRTAVTLAALIAGGLGPRDAVDVAFLMAIPVTAAAGLYEAVLGDGGIAWPYDVVAGAAALLAGLAGIHIMRGIAHRFEGRIAAFLTVQGAIILALTIPALMG